MSDEPFREYFEFDDSDLALNRQGTTSRKQKNRLLRYDALRKSGILVGLIVGLDFAILMAIGADVVINVAAGPRPGIPAWGNWIVIIAGGLAMLAMLVGIVRSMSARLNLPLQKAEGPILVDQKHVRSGFRYVDIPRVKIGETELDSRHFGQKLIEEFTQKAGQRYSVYYVRSPKLAGAIVVSMEPTRNDQAG
ncbi:MAG TPA: hypothetical protein VMT91_08115 [Anaerolineales bacterium]|nr:hypothetical protein [Anaerolineales bacterium]